MPRTRDAHPQTVSGDLANPPAALTALCLMPNWGVWKWQRASKGEGWTKPPFQADQPTHHAANNDPQTWASHSAAVSAVLAGKADGIGFMLTGTEIAALDLDHCRNPETGAIDDWAQAILDVAPDAYHEVTVSGTGLRIIGTASGEAVHRNFPIGDNGARIEVYRKATRYITVSGAEIGQCAALPNIDNVVDSVVARMEGQPSQKKEEEEEKKAEKGNGADDGAAFIDDIDELIKNGVPEGQRHQTFSRVVWSLAAQGMSVDEIEALLAQHPSGIAAKFIKRLRVEVDRCYDKWQREQRQAFGAGIHNWSDPDRSILDDRRGELPDFPIDAFSPAWQSWAANAAHGAGVTVDHVLVPLLGIAGSLIGTARRLRASRSWSEPLTMWTAVVGFSGTGKTPGLDVTKGALAKIEHDRKKKIADLRHQHEGRAERARAEFKAWQAAVKDAADNKQPSPPKPNDADVPEEFVAPRLHVSNVTIERLAVLLNARPRGMLMIVDELAGLFLNLARYSGGTDREFWLEAWNGKSFVVERMGRSAVVIDHLLVGMAGGFQPDKLARSFQGDADGLYTRMLFAWPREPSYQRLTDDIAEVEPQFENALVRLIDLPAEEDGEIIITAVSLTEEARERFEQFRQFTHHEKTALDGREREWWAKAPAHVLRLAGALAYLEWAMRTAGQSMLIQEPERIEAVFVDAAVRLVKDYFWPHSRAALRQVGLSEHHANARRVLRWIRHHKKEKVSREDIRRDALGQSLDAERTQVLLEALERSGWLRRIDTSTGKKGRPKATWWVNPSLLAL